MHCTDGNKIIVTNEKTFKNVYEPKGFKPCDETNNAKPVSKLAKPANYTPEPPQAEPLKEEGEPNGSAND